MLLSIIIYLSYTFLEKNIKLSNQNITVFQWHKHNLSDPILNFWYDLYGGGEEVVLDLKDFKKRKKIL